MWLQILIGTIFLVLITIQILHWYTYFYSRFSPNLREQRIRLKTLVKMSTKPFKLEVKKKGSKEDEDYVNRGYT